MLGTYGYLSLPLLAACHHPSLLYPGEGALLDDGFCNAVPFSCNALSSLQAFFQSAVLMSGPLLGTGEPMIIQFGWWKIGDLSPECSEPMRDSASLEVREAAGAQERLVVLVVLKRRLN